MSQACRNRGKSKPEDQNRQYDAAQSRQDKQQVSQFEQFAGNGRLVGVGKDTTGVEHGLGKIVHKQEVEGNTGEGGNVGAQDDHQVQTRVLDFRSHVLFLGLLEV